MSQRRWVRDNKVVVAILIYLVFFALINYLKPASVYNPDGSLKEFGIGFRRKTIIPAWLISIFVAILAYFSVMYYTSRIR